MRHTRYHELPKNLIQGLLFVGITTLFCSAVLSASAASNSEPDRRSVVLRALVDELNRTMTKLKMPGFESPYFVAYEIKENRSNHVQARYGAVIQSNDDVIRHARVETRVGSYEFDNVGSKTSDYDFSGSANYGTSKLAPLDNEPAALRNSLWLITDENYKSALKGYLKRKSKKVTEIDENKGVHSFSKEAASVVTEPHLAYSFDQKHWEQTARSASIAFKKHPVIFDSLVSTDGAFETRYLATSEGTRIVSEQSFYNLTIQGFVRAADGMLLSSQLSIYTRTENTLPAPEQISELAEKLAHDLEALRTAPIMEPYTGPAILDGEATGVLFHEVIGHRLEGERQLDDEEGKTFKGQIGNKIVPEFLSVVDDPTVDTINGVALNGFYRNDDEGIGAERVTLIQNGTLKNFLTSRTPIEGFAKSNGHGRSAAGEKPRARMGTTWVQSNKTVSFAELKKMLIAEVQKQGKPYGLLIRNILGGSTHTSTWGYQAFKGVPQMVYRIYPDGREELVRGVEIVGTPIASINKIIATSDKLSVFNGFCGAESGYIPVSTIAPDVLMTEIEIQRTAKKSEKDPILPSPWNGKP